MQRLPGGGLGGVAPVQRGPGQVPLLRGAESAGLQHQAVPAVPHVHHAEGAPPGPLGAQVQGQRGGALAVQTSGSVLVEPQGRLGSTYREVRTLV